MKVFEVITEHTPGDSNKVETMRQYVVCDDDSLLTVTKYFDRHCFEYEEELKGVHEVLTVVQQIKSETVTLREGLDRIRQQGGDAE